MSEKTQLSGARLRIKKLILASGLSMNEISRRLGKNNAYIHQYIEIGSPKRLPEDVRQNLASLLGVDEYLLKETPTSEGVKPGMAEKSRLSAFLPAEFRGKLDLPVYLSARPGGARVLQTDPTKPIDWIERPSDLRGADEAFAVMIAGTDMEPIYHADDAVFFHPGLPPVAGRGACVIHHDGRRMVGLYRQTETEIQLTDPGGTALHVVPLDQVARVAREVAVRRR